MKKILLTLTCIFSVIQGFNQAPILSYAPVINSGLSLPVEVVNAGDGSNRLFIVEQNGLIKIYNGTSLLPTPFLSLTTLTAASGERGLLSMAFHPNYSVNGYFFVYYTNAAGDITIARYQVSAGNANQANAASGVVLMNIPKPFANHNGGRLAFGPDGYLYFGTGDGGSGGDPNNFAQNGNSLLGKMIRIDVNNFATPPYYTIPADNPYTTNPGVLDEIWAIGLRNPWRWSFDRLNGDMWIGDVGQSAREEINYRAAGTTGGINYGWRCYEGTLPYNTTGCAAQSTYVSPIFDYPRNNLTGGFSVTGGYVYRGSEFASLNGYYICADYVSGNTWLINPAGAGTWNTTLQSGLPGSIAGFGEAENGTLYAVARGSGIVYKVNVSGVLPVRLLTFNGTPGDGFNELTWATANEENLRSFRLTCSETGTGFRLLDEHPPLNNRNGQTYRFVHHTRAEKMFYRVEAVHTNGSIQYSPVIVVAQNGNSKAVKTFFQNRQLSVISNPVVKSITLYNDAGRKVFSMAPVNRQGYFSLAIPALPNGIYSVQVQTNEGIISSRMAYVY